MKKEKTTRLVNPFGYSSRKFFRRELKKAIPKAKLSQDEEYFIRARFGLEIGLEKHKPMSIKTLSKIYKVEMSKIERRENKILAKIVEQIK